MKKMFVIMMIALCVMTSCSSEKSISRTFLKKGYAMQVLTPERQADIVPFMRYFPRFNAEAMGYLRGDGNATFVYGYDEALWSGYFLRLAENGFDCFETGFVKADYDSGCTYNVSGRKIELYGEELLLVTFAVVAL
jgi:hypothetical protein